MPRHLTRGFCMHFVNNNYRVFATGQQYSQEDANRSRNASYLKCTLSLIPPPARLAATAPLHCTRPGTRALCVTRTGAGAPAGRPTSLKHFGMPPCSSISEGASSTGASWSSRSAGHTSVPQAMRVYGLNSPGTETERRLYLEKHFLRLSYSGCIRHSPESHVPAQMLPPHQRAPYTLLHTFRSAVPYQMLKLKLVFHVASGTILMYVQGNGYSNSARSEKRRNVAKASTLNWQRYRERTE